MWFVSATHPTLARSAQWVRGPVSGRCSRSLARIGWSRLVRDHAGHLKVVDRRQEDRQFQLALRRKRYDGGRQDYTDISEADLLQRSAQFVDLGFKVRHFRGRLGSTSTVAQ